MDILAIRDSRKKDCKMRMLYIGSFRFPIYDAAAARVLNVARTLREIGNEVSFISWGGLERPEDLCDDKVYRFDGFPYVVTKEIDFEEGTISKIKGWLHQGNKTKSILKNSIGQYDAIITYNCSLISWLTRFCKRNDIKLVSDITEWYSYNELKLVVWPGYALDMYHNQKRIKNKIVISQYLNKYYQSSYNIVIPATCDSSEAKWHQGVEKSRINAGVYDGVTLIYAGNPAKKDAVHYVIAAVQRLINEGASIRFIIIGITRDNYLERSKDLLSNGELSARIQFLGRIPQEDVPSYYALADFMVLLREQTRKSNAGFPTKFTESFISGTPVIANLTSDIGAYLKDGETGFIVNEPNEKGIYRILKEKVLTLRRDEIDALKVRTKEVSMQLDYHYYTAAANKFFRNLI